MLSVAAPLTAGAASGSCDSDSNFLGFPTWHRGLTGPPPDCSITIPAGGDSVKTTGDSLANFIWKIVLNVIEIALRIVAFVAVGYILYGGFTYLTANGSPDKAAKGLSLVTNSVIGLIITISSIGIVNKIFEVTKGASVNSSTGLVEMSATNVIKNITDIVYWIAGATAVLMFVMAGIRFISSSGNPSRIQKARQSMIYSVIGLIIVILAFTITNVILGFLA